VSPPHEPLPRSLAPGSNGRVLVKRAEYSRKRAQDR
jgi:hypothetical protein